MSGPHPSPDFPARLSAGQARHLAKGTWPLEVVRSSRIELGRTPAGAAMARQAVTLHLGGIASSLTVQTLDDLRLLTSELATNALVHGDGRNGIVMYLAAALQRVRVEVCDEGSGFAVRRGPPLRDALGGRGLRLLDALSTRWGVAGDDGTCVWFEMDL